MSTKMLTNAPGRQIVANNVLFVHNHYRQRPARTAVTAGAGVSPLFPLVEATPALQKRGSDAGLGTECNEAPHRASNNRNHRAGGGNHGVLIKQQQHLRNHRISQSRSTSAARRTRRSSSPSRPRRLPPEMCTDPG